MLIPESKYIQCGLQFSADQVDKMGVYLPKLMDQLKEVHALPKDVLGISITTQDDVNKLFTEGFVFGMVVACYMFMHNETPEQILG